MRATVHQIQPAATPPAAASGPALRESPAPFSNPLTEKIAWAASLAFEQSNACERTLYAAEYALDEVNRSMKLLDTARAQLTDAIKKQRDYDRLLNNLAHAYMERLVGTFPTDSTSGAVSVLKPTCDGMRKPEAQGTEETGADRPAAPIYDC